MASNQRYLTASKVQELAQLAIQGDYNEFRRQATGSLTLKVGEDVLMLLAEQDDSPPQTAKCVEYLFHLGVNPSVSDSAGNTAAHLAARKDHLRLLTLLPFKVKWLINQRGATPLMEAASNNSWKCTKHLLHLLRQERYSQCDEFENERRDELLKMTDNGGLSALDLAKSNELATLIQLELSLEIDEDGRISGLTDYQERFRQKLQDLAESNKLSELRQEATRLHCDLPDTEGPTALMLACRGCFSSDKSLWNSLAQLADVTCASVGGLSCLHSAARAGNVAAIDALVAAGANVNSIDEVNSWTPLMVAAIGAPARDSASVGKALLKVGADWSLTDSKGRTALALAREYLRGGLADLLRQYQNKRFFDEPLAKPIRVGGEDGNCPHLSIYHVHSKPTTKSSSRFYDVTAPQGVCLIININQFPSGSGLFSRSGSEHDVRRVLELFSELQFNIDLRENLKGDEIVQSMQEMAKRDHSKFGIFVCFLMSHGDTGLVYGADGKRVNIITELAQPFQSSRCISLRRKPKIFFVQACRGNDRLGGFPIAQTDSNKTFPDEADFLFSYANVDGKAVARFSEIGSPFIMKLCEVISSEYRDDHLIDMVTEVNKRVKEMKYTVGEDDTVYCMVPEHVTRLDRRVSLDPSKASRVRTM